MDRSGKIRSSPRKRYGMHTSSYAYADVACGWGRAALQLSLPHRKGVHARLRRAMGGGNRGARTFAPHTTNEFFDSKSPAGVAYAFLSFLCRSPDLRRRDLDHH